MKAIFTFLVFLPIYAFSQCGNGTPGIFKAQVQGDTVILMDDTALRNCGADYWMRVYQFSADTITWLQYDIGDTYGCMCTFNLSATIDSLHPGHYFVKVYYNDLEADVTCFAGMIEFDITKQNAYQWGNELEGAQSNCFTVGVDETPKGTGNALMVYPNPASTFINIKTASPAKKILRIFDINSRSVLEMQSDESTSTIDISNLSPGIYFVSVIQDNFIYRREFCKF